MDISNINTTLTISQLEALEDELTSSDTEAEVDDAEFQKLVESINQRASKLEQTYSESKDTIFASLNFAQIAYDHVLREYEMSGIIRLDETEQSGSTSNTEGADSSSDKVTEEVKPESNTSTSTPTTSTTKNTYGIKGVPSADHITNTKYDSIINEMSEKYEVPVDLIKLVINTESSFKANAVSSSGAQGLMQLMPSTAKWLGVNNAMDPYQNIEGGTKYLRYLLDKYDNDLTLSVAAYNAGPGNVDKYGGVPPFKETQNYVKKILGK